MDLSICILTRNQPKLLSCCVASCIAEIERAGIKGEIIVIDNASSDQYPQKVAAPFPNVRIIRNEENLGFSAGNNKAIRASRGCFVLILNDDAIMQQGSLGLMLRKLESDIRIGAVGPKLLNPDGSPQVEMTNKRFPSLRAVFCMLTRLDRLMHKFKFTRDLFILTRDPDRSGDAEHLAGACLLLRREALDAVGLFDEGFYFWYEDGDLCYCLKEKGWRVYYLAESEVLHWGSSSFKTTRRPEKAAMAFNSTLYYFKKHSAGPKVLLVRAVLVLILVARLPVVAALEISSNDSKRREWKNTTREYWRLIRRLVAPDK